MAWGAGRREQAPFMSLVRYDTRPRRSTERSQYTDALQNRLTHLSPDRVGSQLCTAPQPAPDHHEQVHTTVFRDGFVQWTADVALEVAAVVVGGHPVPISLRYLGSGGPRFRQSLGPAVLTGYQQLPRIKDRSSLDEAHSSFSCMPGAQGCSRDGGSPCHSAGGSHCHGALGRPTCSTRRSRHRHWVDAQVV
jgi:hypothetical protein